MRKLSNSVTSCAEVSSGCDLTDVLTLANLLQQEKEYSKQLNLLESLTSFIAYASASPPSGFHAISRLAGGDRRSSLTICAGCV